MEADALGYYRCLDLQSGASEQTLKINYREKAKYWHPDHNKAENALEEFQKISRAYDILKNPNSRKIYDLLSLTYIEKEFPDLDNLKLYKAVNGSDTPFLRVFKLQKTLPGKCKEENLIGTFDDAKKFICSITQSNWLKGWLPLKNIRLNIRALKQNYSQINKNTADNFKMLIHNAAVYYKAGNETKAYLSAVQALDYANAFQKQKTLDFIHTLNPDSTFIPQWDYNALKKLQLKIPYTIGAGISLLLIFFAVPLIQNLLPEKNDDKIFYYQEVRFNSGAETVDDIVTSKIFNIPVDTSDIQMLYHTTAAVKVMHGPSTEFDVLAEAGSRQTVRVTGYTPDKQWYRVMLDNGEMGFIKKQYLKKGIGREIPAESNIFRNPEI